MLCSLPSSALGPPTVASYRGGDWDRIHRSCDTTSGDACALLGMDALDDDHPASAATFFTRACDRGTLDACLLGEAATSIAAPQLDRTKLVTLVSPACRKGNGEACAALAMTIGADNITHLVRDEETEALLEQSCAAQPSQYYVGSLGTPGTPMIGGSCAVLALMIRSAPKPGEAARASELEIRACQLGAESMCAPNEKP